MADSKLHTEVVDLPSKGWFYPPNHPLSSGQIELYSMTAQHEDILTSPNLISKGIVLDKLMEALIVDKSIKYGDLLIGDKNAIMIASRILGYGKDYDATIECPSCNSRVGQEVDLQQLDDKVIDFPPGLKGKNEFKFTLPISEKEITFRLLTHKDEVAARREIDQMAKMLKGGVSKEITTRMRYSIIAVDDDRDPEVVRQFVENMPARDGVAFREYAKKVNPNVDLTVEFDCPKCGHSERVEVPIDVNFFWPNARI